MQFLKGFIVICIGLLYFFPGYAQQAPSEGENIGYLMTFGNKAKTEWGDDDFCQIFFVLIPSQERKPFYIRVFDPNIGGTLDEANKEFDTKVQFSVYGGKGAFTNKDARSIDPKGSYDSGNLLASKIFGQSKRYDYDWYPFGPFNPSEGEYVPAYRGKVFKIIAQGIAGDDGNAYKYYISTRSDQNVAVEGANLFTYEYTVRLKQEANSLAHIYPFIDSKSIAIQQSNFDFDTDGEIRLVSVVKNAHKMAKSTNGVWVSSKHQILPAEQNSTIDIQIHKKSLGINNISFYITNQYDQAMPFFAIPLGGAPKYEYDVDIMYHGQ